MAFIARFGVALVLVAATLPFVAADSRSSSCKSKEFWLVPFLSNLNWTLKTLWRCRYDEKSCCLPLGGPSSHPEPPPEKQCPPTNWSWNKKYSCCVPHYPRPHPHPHPQCHQGWEWEPATSCCKRHHPPRPQPSGHWHAKNHVGQKRGNPGSSRCGRNEFW
jgi:hypothetical protein